MNKKATKLIRKDSRNNSGKVDMREYRHKKKLYTSMNWHEKTIKLNQIRMKDSKIV